MFLPFQDTWSVQSQLQARYASGRVEHTVRPRSSLQVLTKARRRARRHDEGLGAAR